MNIKILDSWLREHLDTNATPLEIAECMSLCGPSFERIEKRGKDYLYDIEVTTNRVDAMSVIGIAREAAAILPTFGYSAKLKPLKQSTGRKISNSVPLEIKMAKAFTNRLMGVVFSDVKNWETPAWMVERLEASDIRSLNAPVDITNYVMLEIGHPTHVFDYDLLKDKTLRVRESKRGERITSLENKQYSLPGGDIVFVNSNDTIFDLPGIIGTKNSVVNSKTKSVLFFLDNNDPLKIRRTSMTLNIRTNAATLNEKGVDPELAEIAMKRGIELFENVCKATQVSRIFDEYPKPYKPKTVTADLARIEKILGISIDTKFIEKTLSALGFGVSLDKNKIQVSVPSWRTSDINIQEDIAEEIARIYGYHNIASNLMAGMLPAENQDSPFGLERKIRNLIIGWGGVEILTQALTSKELAGSGALRLKNPLGGDREYLRTTLHNSLLEAANINTGRVEHFHLFEIANVYIPRKSKLPLEKTMLAGVIEGQSLREGKGIVEALFEALYLKPVFTPLNSSVCYKPHKAIKIILSDASLGELGETKDGYIYYEIDFAVLVNFYTGIPTYTPIPKYPAQTEDITFIMTSTVSSNELITLINETHKNIVQVEVFDLYKNFLTLRIYYQDRSKTLTDDEVEKIRLKILKTVKGKLNIETKD